MAFDGLLCAALAKELHAALCGARIEKIYQPAEDELLLRFHRGGEKTCLYMTSSGGQPRIHLTEEKGSQPQSPTALCMLLRKHFQGGKVSGVRQISSERILSLEVEGTSELGLSARRSLRVEMMGKHSNIIAVDEDTGRIIDSVKRVSFDMSRVRQVFPGQEYQLPPDQGKVSLQEITPALLVERIHKESGISAKDLTATAAGLSPFLAEEILLRAEAKLSGSLRGTTSEVAAISAAIRELLETAAGFDGPVPARIYCDEEGNPKDFHFLCLQQLDTLKTLEFPSLSAAIDFYYANKNAACRLRQRETDLSRALEATLSKHRLKQQRLLEDLEEAENAEKYRVYGEILTANLHAVPNGASAASLVNYYTGETIEIPLDPKYAPGRNAQNYFKKYAKSRTALKEKTMQLEENQKHLDYLASVAALLENAPDSDTVEELRRELTENGYLRRRKDTYKRTKARPKPMEYRTSGGFRLLAGRSNTENDYLTTKLADKKDLWFHTKDIPGSHVILLLEGREPDETDLREAAALAAFHSKGRHSENVPVDYVPVRHVKKPAGAKPGMVIFTGNRTLYVDPAEPPQK